MEWKKLLCEERIRSVQKKKNSADLRSEFAKDYHRIIGSASFRRLQDKTQVFPLDRSDFVRTRLTHSLEVSSFSKSLGQMISARIIQDGLEQDFLPAYEEYICDILQCAGLIHDIGNPPFGHFGENAIREWFLKNMPRLTYKGKKLTEILTDQMQADFYHFEGNTQAFRLVTKLHFLVDAHGMNLTKGLLSAMIKYPVSSLEIDPDSPDIRCHKMGYFYADEETFRNVERSTGTYGCRNPLTFALEAADDIAYRTADIEDGFRKGLISYNTLCEELKNSVDQGDDRQIVFLELLQKRYRRGMEMGAADPEDYALQNWMVDVQGRALQAAAASFGDHYDEIMKGTFQKELLEGTPAGRILDILGDVAVKYVFHSESIYKREIAEEVIIDYLLDKFVDAAIYYDTAVSLKPTQKKLMALVSENYRTVYNIYSEGKGETEKLYLRLLLVTDYICGMTDNYARTLYEQLCGFRMD